MLIGPGSVYALNPCTEEAAREAIDSMESRPLILLKLPEVPQIAERTEEYVDSDPDESDIPR